MTKDQIEQLRNEFPDVPRWLVERNGTLKQAREMMHLRRKAFPGTAESHHLAVCRGKS